MLLHRIPNPGNAMPRADFYLIDKPRFREQPLLLVCELAKRAFAAQQPTLILTRDHAQAEAIDELLWAFDEDAFIPHQANMRIIDSMIKALKLPDHVAVARDIETTGNTSAASIPLAMERLLATGQAKSGDTALVIGFGAGLVYAATVVTLP